MLGSQTLTSYMGMPWNTAPTRYSCFYSVTILQIIQIREFMALPECIPTTAKVKQQFQETFQKLQVSSVAQLWELGEYCTAEAPESRRRASTEDAHKAPSEHFHSEIWKQNNKKAILFVYLGIFVWFYETVSHYAAYTGLLLH